MSEKWTNEELLNWQGMCRFWNGNRPENELDYYIDQLYRVKIDSRGTRWEDMNDESWEHCEPIFIIPATKPDENESEQKMNPHYLITTIYFHECGT